MAKLKHLCAVFFFLTLFQCGWAQDYRVHYSWMDPLDSLQEKPALDSVFPSRNEASLYILRLPSYLQTKGYVTASVDSVGYDSLRAEVQLFLGNRYQWALIHTRPENQPLLDAVRWPKDSFPGPFDFQNFRTWQQKILDYLEENGHPFGKTFLDSIEIRENEVEAVLQIEPGPLYLIDSIRVYGDAKVSNDFLQRYLQIKNGSVYNKKRLGGISRKLAELSFIQEDRPSDLSLLGTGSVLNLYLRARRTSQANALIGFLPNSDQLSEGKKLLITADVNILLRNAFGSGETIGLVWQQLQQSSPRLNLLFDRPYIFHSPFGFNFSFDMYKKDSTFLNIQMNLGTTYQVSERRSASIFLQRRQSIVNGVNTAQVLQTKRLPQEADVQSSNLGLGYAFNGTDYRRNPRKGSEFSVTATAGTKNIRRNNQILELKDPSNPSFKFASLYDTVKLKAYQFRITAAAAAYLPLGKQSTFRLGAYGGVYQSANYFRNELFQIGGFRLLRGFDEESQFVSQYAIGSVEYRYRVGQNSYFFAFGDGGWGNHIREAVKHHSYIGTGLGLSFETKAGVMNLAWAIGKRDDLPLNLRQSKVHLGFASFF